MHGAKMSIRQKLIDAINSDVDENQCIGADTIADRILQDVPEVDQLSGYHSAFEAAKAFIESHAADPDLTAEMCDKYKDYQMALKALKPEED